MSLRHLETQIMDQTRSADYRTITAKTNTRFEFFNNGEWVPAVHITETSFQVRRKAPQRRVVQRIETAAWEGVCAYMNGDDNISDVDNIFSDVKADNEQTSLPAELERDLLQELEEIERELHIAA